MNGGDCLTIDVIKDIQEAETQAEQIEKQAQNAARQKVADAKAEAGRIIEQAEADAKAEADAMLRKSEERAKAEISKINARNSMECAELKDVAHKKFPKAIDIITGRIVKFNVNY